MNLSGLHSSAVDEFFKQPIVVSLHTLTTTTCTASMNLVLGLHHNVVREGLHVFVFQDTFDMQVLMARSVKYTINFLEAKEEDLHR